MKTYTCPVCGYDGVEDETPYEENTYAPSYSIWVQ